MTTPPAWLRSVLIGLVLVLAVACTPGAGAESAVPPQSTAPVPTASTAPQATPPASTVPVASPSSAGYHY